MEIKKYYGKVILFGEYSMIFGSPAMLMPLYTSESHWDYIWRKRGKRNYSSNRSLHMFANYLSENEYFTDKIDIQKFTTELKRGLFLDSCIPSGYGVGSSGALTAAVYDRFKSKEIEDLLELKKFLGDMENCFHGSSSGLDPLQCYLGKPFIITEDKQIKLLEKDFMPSNIHVFLIDSQVKSDTKSLVNYFKEQRENPKYLKAFNELYYPFVGRCIDSLVSGDEALFFENLRHLSYYQTIMMRPMITDNMLPLFSLKHEDVGFQIKICGSGGGGYFLGFADDVDKTNDYMKESGFPITWVL
ncbi:MAG: hypothetical protein J5708_08635 [Bacteroidales bacterium]|nr:hypothetical protein [Bacteroidales bacterium]